MMASAVGSLMLLIVTVPVLMVKDTNTQNTQSEETGSHDTPAHKPRGSVSSKQDMSHEKQLVVELVQRYKNVTRQGRPVRDSAHTVPVQFGLGLIQMDLDERSKILTMSMWSKYIWRDQYLTWYPPEYGNITTVRMEASLIWIPDIMLYNTAAVENSLRDSLVVIQYDGVVLWFPHTIFKSSCSVDVSNFPFDNQRCHMWFGSWTHPTKEVNLTMAGEHGLDLSTFQTDHKEGCVWDVYNVTTGRRLMPSENADPNYAVLTFGLSLARKRVFLTYILTLPCVFLACLTLVVFLLPPERPDRTGLAMSLFGSFMVLLLILVEAAPPTASSIPSLGIYYCFNLVIIMFSIFLSSVVVHVSRGGTRGHMFPVPAWLKVLTLKLLAKIVFVKIDMDSKDQSCSGISSPLLHHPKSGLNYSHFGLWFRENTSGKKSTKYQQEYKESNHGPAEDNGNIKLEEEIHRLRLILCEIRQELQRLSDIDTERNRNSTNWRMVSVVIDRVFFVLYLVLIIVNLVCFFPRP